MKKISNIVNRRLPEIPVAPDDRRPHPHTSVGIEVEVEGVQVDEFESKRWKVVKEGSLQNGVEFVSDPVWGTAIVDALDELTEFFGQNPPYISYQTSVHIHDNVLDMYPHHLERMVKG